MFDLVAIYFLLSYCSFATSEIQTTEKPQHRHSPSLDPKREMFHEIVPTSPPFQTTGRPVRETVSYPSTSRFGDLFSDGITKRDHTKNEPFWKHRTDRAKKQSDDHPSTSRFGGEFLLAHAIIKRGHNKNEQFGKHRNRREYRNPATSPPLTQFGRVLFRSNAVFKRGHTQNKPFGKQRSRDCRKKENIEQPPTSRFGRVFPLCNPFIKRGNTERGQFWKNRDHDYRTKEIVATQPVFRYGQIFLPSDVTTKRDPTQNEPIWKHVSPDYNKGILRVLNTYNHVEHPGPSNSKLPSVYNQGAKARKHVFVPRHQLFSFNIAAPPMSQVAATNIQRKKVNSQEIYGDFIENEELEALIDELQ